METCQRKRQEEVFGNKLALFQIELMFLGFFPPLSLTKH